MYLLVINLKSAKTFPKSSCPDDDVLFWLGCDHSCLWIRNVDRSMHRGHLMDLTLSPTCNYQLKQGAAKIHPWNLFCLVVHKWLSLTIKVRRARKFCNISAPDYKIMVGRQNINWWAEKKDILRMKGLK